MTDREVIELALEALEFFDNNVSNPAEKFITSKAITALRQALEQPEPTSGNVLMDAYNAMVDKKRKALEQPECNKHPDAPHGFNRESSHSLGRYVCDCEGWEPEPVAVASIKNGYPNAWLWNSKYVKDNPNVQLKLYTAPPKPAQDLIVGYADSHDLNRDGHDFWVSREPGKNTVPLYLYGHPPKIWQGLTDEEIAEGAKQSWVDKQAFESAVWWAEEKLKEKNK